MADISPELLARLQQSGGAVVDGVQYQPQYKPGFDPFGGYDPSGVDYWISYDPQNNDPGTTYNMHDAGGQFYGERTMKSGDDPSLLLKGALAAGAMYFGLPMLQGMGGAGAVGAAGAAGAGGTEITGLYGLGDAAVGGGLGAVEAATAAGGVDAASEALTAVEGLGAPNAVPPPSSSFWSDAWNKFQALPFEKQLKYGSLALMGASPIMSKLSGSSEPSGEAPYTGPLSRYRMSPNYQYYKTASTENMAGGGLADLYVGTPALAGGGLSSLGSYSNGGQLLQGPGDGVSDDIPAIIADKQPARLAEGEYVVPARIVSELGNGSTKAGADQLDAMLLRVQNARKATLGRDSVARNSNPRKLLPA